MQPMTIGIVGLGLIGGSMALTWSETTGHTLLGADSNPITLAAAVERGAISRTCEPDDWQKLDVLVLALAPHTTMEFLKEHVALLHPGAVVTDVCGVKAAVVDACTPLCAAHGVRFVGGHPMAGREKNGFSHADTKLFKGASYIVTPREGETDPEALALVRELARELGCARVTVTTPETHDRMIAFTSQVPHVLAGAYVQSPCCQHHIGYSAGSYRDVSRVATIDEKLWSELFLLNRPALCAELDLLIHSLEEYRAALEDGDEEGLRRLIRAGRECKENAK